MTGKTKLFMGNLDPVVTEEQLRELLRGCGEIKGVRIVREEGIAFVEMGDEAQVAKAKQAFDGVDFMGRKIRVDMARSPQRRQRRDYRRF